MNEKCSHSRTEVKMDHYNEERIVAVWCLNENCTKMLAFKVEKVETRKDRS